MLQYKDHVIKQVSSILGPELKVVANTHVLGGTGFTLDIFHKNVKVCRQNSPVWTTLSIDTIAPSTYTIEGWQIPKRAGIKFRKIKSDNPEKLLKSLLKWVDRNKETFVTVATEENTKP